MNLITMAEPQTYLIFRYKMLKPFDETSLDY